MKVLVTGNLGYVGTTLTQYLKERNFEVEGLDIGYYKDCVLDKNYQDIPTILKDIRDITVDDLRNFDAVIHLAALSNDPIGELDSDITYQINQDASIKTAQLARDAGVTRFIFVSTQSIYGISTSDEELPEDGSIKNPQTAYAKSKWTAEEEIIALKSNSFTVCALRPSTVFGWSARLRTDIVFNNLLLNGLKNGEIHIHSDGTPWRPIVHVEDLAEAICLALEAKSNKINGESFNIGKIGGNYTVKEIAEAAQSCLGDVELVFNTENISDPRSYKVSFVKAKETLGFHAKRELVESGMEILDKIRILNINVDTVLGESTNRLARVIQLREKGIIDDQLRRI